MRLLINGDAVTELGGEDTIVELVDAVAARLQALVYGGEVGKEDVTGSHVGLSQPLLDSLHVGIYSL